MKIVNLKITDLEVNIGQIPKLPMNPRRWSSDDVNKLALSLEETPELFEARPIIVVPFGERYVILGGNMRFEASKVNEFDEVPCVVLPEKTPVKKLKEIVIKDNGTFGQWDLQALKSDWANLPLPDWGAPSWAGLTDGIPSDLDAEKKNAPFVCKLTFANSEQMKDFVSRYMDVIEQEYPGVTVSETGGEL